MTGTSVVSILYRLHAEGVLPEHMLMRLAGELPEMSEEDFDAAMECGVEQARLMFARQDMFSAA